MRCAICHGETKVEVRSITLERGGRKVTFQKVLVEVCQECGEVFVDEKTSKFLLIGKDENGDAFLK